jgi:uncharacterized protein YjbI with pentapeptide repeats
MVEKNEAQKLTEENTSLKSKLSTIKTELEGTRKDNESLQAKINNNKKVRRRSWFGGLLQSRVLEIIIALIPTVFLIQQNSLIREQIQQQEVETTIVRRAGLISTLYDRDCSLLSIEQNIQSKEKTNPANVDILMNDCPPKADARSRAEAVSAFVRMEKQGGIINPNLSGVLLQNTSLRLLDLTSLNLSGANLSKTNLYSTSFEGTNFRYANLSFAHLAQGNFSSTDFSDANLSFANLTYANFSKAILLNTNLTGANLSGAILAVEGVGAPAKDEQVIIVYEPAEALKTVSFFNAIYTDDTVWPEGFDPKIAQAINCSEDPKNGTCVAWTKFMAQ